MSTVVDQLVDMGFERARAEYAFAQTGKGALEAVSLTSYSQVSMYYFTDIMVMETFVPTPGGTSEGFFFLIARGWN
ncbi:hypothetical protein Aduo_002261 [Ancylostoma duodenale]